MRRVNIVGITAAPMHAAAIITIIVTYQYDWIRTHQYYIAYNSPSSTRSSYRLLLMYYINATSSV